MDHDTEAEVTAPVVAKKARKNTTAAAGGGRRVAKKPTHPPANEMVLAAVTALGERKGSSLQAIKKYIANSFECDVVKCTLRIRKALTSSVESGKLVRTRGTGASGSFKLKGHAKKRADAAATAGGRKTRKPTGKEAKKKNTTSQKAADGRGEGSRPKPKEATASGRKKIRMRKAATTTTNATDGETVLSKQETTNPTAKKTPAKAAKQKATVPPKRAGRKKN